MSIENVMFSIDKEEKYITRSKGVLSYRPSEQDEQEGDVFPDEIEIYIESEGVTISVDAEQLQSALNKFRGLDQNNK